MNIAAKQSGTSAITGTPMSFAGPVAIYQFTAAKTAISDSTDVQLSDMIAPVPRKLYFIVRLDAITAYANGDGAAPVVTLKGSTTGSTTAMTAAGDAAGTFKLFYGQLDPNEKLLFTPTAGTGTTETGTARVSVTIIDPVNG